MIELTLLYKQQTLDIFVPRKLSFNRLSCLLKETFAENGELLPDNYLLKFVDKTVIMAESDCLGDFGVSNGDRLEIFVGEVSEVI
ncbi:hypothetical protein [Pseudolactococcus paracarnosus]|uniref:Type VII secretion protein, YukD family n=1 Tax=Pseudolactococcus paracarnosus TaxID=2749962 RepID=A0ABT0ALZ8_9LACT|nr:hypothetical protein [Lactococcus paracarnosus]MCJ1977527.1 hypothetical protein [Lactococcus paracarnosus]MCJ1983670.1 hypothetical protein [Lactococcus paracarnosus]MCJ1999262.1 hypothetical protein [Lactococcus paracarnosus]